MTDPSFCTWFSLWRSKSLLCLHTYGCSSIHKPTEEKHNNHQYIWQLNAEKKRDTSPLRGFLPLWLPSLFLNHPLSFICKVRTFEKDFSKTCTLMKLVKRKLRTFNLQHLYRSKLQEEHPSDETILTSELVNFSESSCWNEGNNIIFTLIHTGSDFLKVHWQDKIHSSSSQTAYDFYLEQKKNANCFQIQHR